MKPRKTNIPEDGLEFGSKGHLALQARREARNQEVPVVVYVVCGIDIVSEYLTHVLGTCAGVDGLEDEDLFLWPEVTPLLTDPDIRILVARGRFCLLVDVALFNQVLPGSA